METSHIDALAAESCVVEFPMIDSPDLITAYQGFWTGSHAVSHTPTPGSLIRESAAAGYSTILLTDEPIVARHPLAESFDQCHLIDAPGTTAAASFVEHTQLGKLTAAAIDMIHRTDRPTLLWVHAQGMQGPWDAAWQWRVDLAGVDDPDPPDMVEPPCVWLDPQGDPDIPIGFQQAYGAQVRVLDECIGAVRESLSSLPPAAGKAALLVTSPRSFPLGEHLAVGTNEPLYSELTHVPLIIWNGCTPFRSASMAQPQDTWATLKTWLAGQDVADDIVHPSGGRDILGQHLRQQAISITGDQVALRTPAWYLKTTIHNDSATAHEQTHQPSELYVKPDDRYEFNDVCELCHDEVALMQDQLNRFIAAVRERRFDRLPAIDDPLRNQLR